MAVPPYPVPPQPVTWAAGNQILMSGIRADMLNAARLLSCPPMFGGSQTTTGQSLSAGISNLTEIDTESYDDWGMHQVPASPITARFPGWYLLNGYTETTSVSDVNTVSTGFRVVNNGTVTDMFGGQGPGNGVNDQGYPGAALVKMDPSTGDECALITSVTAGCTVAQAQVAAEWVGLPSSSPVWPTGVVVPSPQPASPWPDGSGTTMTAGVTAGATSVTVEDPTGIVTGGTLGLDYLDGVAVSDLAEQVTVTSVAGQVIGISATAYPHGGGITPGVVAVPVSAAFLNEQVRDFINFWCYRPMFSAYYDAGSQGLPTLTFPQSTVISLPSKTIDNFSGWNGSTQYTFPVSGTWFCYGQVAAQAAVNYTLTAGLGVSGMTINWGTSVRNLSSTAIPLTAAVWRTLRVTAGQYITLFANQDAYGSVDLANSGLQNASRMICVFRSF